MKKCVDATNFEYIFIQSVYGKLIHEAAISTGIGEMGKFKPVTKYANWRSSIIIGGQSIGSRIVHRRQMVIG